jgi:galactokinase/mevalonate kinase-like predicted kinase
MYLVNTGIKRSSTSVLQSVDIDKSATLLPLVDELENAIEAENHDAFERIFNEGWKQKKATSNMITANSKIKQMDELFSENPKIHAVKRCRWRGLFSTFV